MKRTKAELETELSIFRTSPDWDYIEDRKGNIQYVSDAVETITGYTTEEFKKEKNLLGKIVHPDDLNLYLSHIIQSYQQDPPKPHDPIEFRLFHKDGLIRHISHNCILIYIDGEYFGKRVVNRDITNVQRIKIERDTYKKAYELKEWLLQESIEAAPYGIMILDQYLKKIMHNSKYYKTFGLDMNTMQNKPMSEQIKIAATKIKDPKKYFQDLNDATNNTKETTTRIELKDGSIVERTVKPLGDNGFLLMARKIK